MPRIAGDIVLAHVVVLSVLVCLAILYVILQPSPEPLIGPAGVMLAALFGWSAWSWWRLAHSLFDPYILFLAAATLFNGGQALLEIFHLNANGILDGAFSADLILPALYLVILGLAAFHLGALVAATSRTNRRVQTAPGRRAGTTIRRRLWLVGWGLLVISAIPTLLLLKNALTIVLSSGYFALYNAQAGVGFGAATRVLAGFLVPAALFLLAGSKGRPGGIIVSAIVILTYTAFQFFLGSRAAAVMPLLAYAWLWDRSIRRLPKIAILAASAALLFVVFPVVQATRLMAGSERLSLPVLLATFLSIRNPAVAAISEMGWSMITVVHTLVLVPAARGFDFGASYFYALLTLMPNLFWPIHPTVAHGLLSDWLVRTVDPGYAAAGGGFGFSFIAEAYLNFGWFGSLPLLFLMGLLFARLVLWAQSPGDPARLAAVASFSAFLFVFARGEAGIVVRSLVWYAFLPYLCALVRFRSEQGQTAKTSTPSGVTRGDDG